MSKPLWIRICGWLALVCVPLYVYLDLITWAPESDVHDVSVLVLFMGAVFATPLWLIGTLIHRSRVHRARIQAAAFREAFRGPR